MSNFDLGRLTKPLVTYAVAFGRRKSVANLFFARLAFEIEVKTDSLKAALGTGSSPPWR